MTVETVVTVGTVVTGDTTVTDETVVTGETAVTDGAIVTGVVVGTVNDSFDNIRSSILLPCHGYNSLV